MAKKIQTCKWTATGQSTNMVTTSCGVSLDVTQINTALGTTAKYCPICGKRISYHVSTTIKEG